MEFSWKVHTFELETDATRIVKKNEKQMSSTVDPCNLHCPGIIIIRLTIPSFRLLQLLSPLEIPISIQVNRIGLSTRPDKTTREVTSSPLFLIQVNSWIIIGTSRLIAIRINDRAADELEGTATKLIIERATGGGVQQGR